MFKKNPLRSLFNSVNSITLAGLGTKMGEASTLIPPPLTKLNDKIESFKPEPFVPKPLPVLNGSISTHRDSHDISSSFPSSPNSTLSIPKTHAIKSRPEDDLIQVSKKDKESELIEVISAALTLVELKEYEQASMLYDVIDSEFKRYYDSFSAKERLRNLYSEFSFYIWAYDAYVLAAQRLIKDLKPKFFVAKKLMKQVLMNSPSKSKAFTVAKSHLTFVDSILTEFSNQNLASREVF